MMSVTFLNLPKMIQCDTGLEAIPEFVRYNGYLGLEDLTLFKTLRKMLGVLRSMEMSL